LKRASAPCWLLTVLCYRCWWQVLGLFFDPTGNLLVSLSSEQVPPFLRLAWIPSISHAPVSLIMIGRFRRRSLSWLLCCLQGGTPQEERHLQVTRFAFAEPQPKQKGSGGVCTVC
jgi:hypothetical protein